MSLFIAIIPKSPLPHKGRMGKIESQDWYKTCLAAANISKRGGNLPIFISSAFQSEGVYEADYYKKVLRSLGVTAKIIVQYQGLETVGHLYFIFAFAKENNLEPIIVSTFLHSPRVKFIARRHNYSHEHWSVLGIPRPKEAITDIILTFLFPIISWLGLEKKFIKKNTGRRKEGKI